VRVRIRRKLRRCLRAARKRAEQPVPDPGGDPGDPAPGTPGDPGTPAPLGRFLGVTASDSDGFRFTLSRPAVAAGVVTVQLRNTDSGPHDLAIRPEAGGDKIVHFEPVDPGGVHQQPVTLAKGRWYLFCSLEGHEAAGMHAVVRAE
jgi:hypothetical protein